MKTLLLSLCVCAAISSAAQTEWELSNNGINSTFFCYDIVAKNGRVFTSGSHEAPGRVAVLFTSNDEARTWQQVAMTGQPVGAPILNSLCYTGKKLLGVFTNTQHNWGPMVSEDDGKTWKYSIGGLDTTNQTIFNFLALNDAEILASGSDNAASAMFKSNDTGKTWTKIAVQNPPGFITSMSRAGDRIFGIINLEDIYVTTDSGKNWKTIGNIFPGSVFYPDLVSGNGKNLLVMGAQYKMSIFESVDSGQTWQEFPYSIKDNAIANGFNRAAYDNGVYYAVIEGSDYIGRVFVSNRKLSVNNTLNRKLDVYPNPANNYLNIALNNSSFITAEIFSLQGQKICTAAIQGQSIDISGLTQGIYMLKAFDGDYHYISKFVKE